MLAGVLSIDRVLLVVAADDGPRPQTIEHLDILELIDVAEVTGVVTKIDRVRARSAPRRSSAEVAGMLADGGYADSPIFPVSSHTGDGIAALTRHLQESARLAERARAATTAVRSFSDADRSRLHPSRDRAGRDRHDRAPARSRSATA